MSSLFSQTHPLALLSKMGYNKYCNLLLSAEESAMMMSDPAPFSAAAEGKTRHWSPQSEPYASGEALLQALESDWKVDGVIFRQEVPLGGDRRTYVYHVNLRRDHEQMKMKMVHNPFIARLIYRLNVQVVRQNQRKNASPERRITAL
jgi:hypothetical protein